MPMELAINGTPFVVDLSKLPADITLNTYIRDHAGLSGTKFMCLEGGCGVCVCVVQGKHPVSGELQSWTVNSCLTLLNICHGWNVTTIEGIGNKLDGYHPIQTTLAKFHGSQCGYCSPGMVMNMYGLLKSKNGKVTMHDVENSFGGNICRCTGYRPILDAMKTFSTDSAEPCQDIEDLTAVCQKTGQKCSGICQQPLVSYADGVKWFWPKTFKGLLRVVKSFGDEKYMLVAGNTAHGVYRRDEGIKNYIDVNKIPDLHVHRVDKKALILGANLTLTETMEVFRKAAEIPVFEYCQELYNHFDLIANVPVRNMGTLAGNLMTKYHHPEFPSDIFITFEALNVTVILASDSKTAVYNLADFRKKNMRGKVILAFKFTPYPKDIFTFKSFKIMPRAQNAHAYVNSAFLLQTNPTNGNVVTARFCFGGISPEFVHASATERLVVGKYLFANEILQIVFESLYQELKLESSPLSASADYRKKLACGLFYKFILSIAPRDKLQAKLVSGGDLLKRPLSSGKQAFETTAKTFPITEPVKKLEALVQCSGEAKYMNDLAAQVKQVWCAFVHATKVGAEILDIDTTEALRLPGVVAFYSAKDIPGVNSFADPKFFFMDTDEEIFCAGKVKYHGQPLGLVVAENSALANFAASKVSVTYSMVDNRVFATIKDVLECNQNNRLINVLESSIKSLPATSAADVSATGTLEFGLQYHFTMEPHTTVVIPTESRLEVYSSTQWMDMTQHAIARCVQMKMSDVQLKVRRLGGGFGGKITRGNPVACAASIAAVKLNRPVRFVQTIESMMRSLGKRWACYCEYEFQAISTGKILGIQSRIYEDAGWATSENAIAGIFPTSLRNCYDLDLEKVFKIDAKIVLTDAPNHAWCRAPGTVEAFGIIESIMEHIAFEADLDPVDVRLENIAANFKMRNLLEGFLIKTEYRKRRKETDSFNEANRWRKRGLGMALMHFRIFQFGPFPATVSIYHGDGTVVISHGGTEMGQGINTKAAQVAAFVLEIPLEMVRIESSDTVNGANAAFTGGSIGSECVCFAVRKACEVLLERLRPIRELLKNPDWLSLVEQAHVQGINLIASEHFKTGDLENYDVFGVTLTEVEIDVLTGNHLIKRVDLTEDTGESLNPTVDVGQIEGAFVMGLGYYLTEQLVYDRQTGEMLTNCTWDYKPPGVKDIPIDFRIELIQKSPNAAGFMRSKSTGEPATCMAVSAIFAIQHALQSARKDAGMQKKWISLGAPTTPEHILLNAGSDLNHFRL